MKIRKIAFFVEGQTEQIFVNRLVRYILGPKKTTIIQRRIKGGTNVPKIEMTINKSETVSPLYEVLIINCGSDNRVKSEMLENMDNLELSGYEYIIGLRDLYPLPLSELEKLKKGLSFLPKQYKNRMIHFDIVLAIREVEAWFLGDKTLFYRMNNRLTDHFIRENIGYVPSQIKYQKIEHPADELSRILQLVGLSYSKKYNQTKKVVYSLDIHVVMKELRSKIKELDQLITYIQKIKEVKKHR